jgi:DNA-binding XRE family transcriptional regulator
MRIGHLLYYYRSVHRIGQRKMAAQIGVGLSTYNRIENGKEVDSANLVKLFNWVFGQGKI